MAWCEANGVHFLFGLAKTDRLIAEIEANLRGLRRLWFASMAYVLLCALRRIALHHTPFAKATCGTIRLKLLKIGGLVRMSARRIKVTMASACPAAHTWGCAAERLRPCRQRAGLARLTHVAATRNPRGITPGPSETASRLS